jgi:hypothetical protein
MIRRTAPILGGSHGGFDLFRDQSQSAQGRSGPEQLRDRFQSVGGGRLRPGDSAIGRGRERVGNSNLAIDQLNAGDFLPGLQRAIVGGEDHLLITLHGFDYRFREAVMRSGYVGAWFAKGRPAAASTIVAFSWPSLGSLTIDAYKKDYQSAGSSGGAFRRFLLALIPLLRPTAQQMPIGASP